MTYPLQCLNGVCNALGCKPKEAPNIKPPRVELRYVSSFMFTASSTLLNATNVVLKCGRSSQKCQGGQRSVLLRQYFTTICSLSAASMTAGQLNTGLHLKLSVMTLPLTGYESYLLDIFVLCRCKCGGGGAGGKQ